MKLGKGTRYKDKHGRRICYGDILHSIQIFFRLKAILREYGGNTLMIVADVTIGFLISVSQGEEEITGVWQQIVELHKNHAP